MWPFSTIKRLTAERDEARAIAEGLRSYRAQDERTAALVAEHVFHLQRLVAEGRFRNPKTGRLGVKGQTFD
jgi:inactivated superfamily I helicase